MLPYKWSPYPYQRRALVRYFGADGAPAQTRQIHVWSRRLGKDRFAMELAALASQRRVMNIWHMFPLHKQARLAIWNGIDPETGQRFLDQTFPPEMIVRRSDAQMMLEFANGSTYQMLGSDAYNSVVGSNPGLVIFSEYALSDPLAWAYISPIIRQNNGGAVFISTYRGRNHHFQLTESVRDNPEWLVTFENVETARKDDGSYVYPRERAELELVHMERARWEEEYLNNARLGLEGAYLAFLLSVAEVQDRVCNASRINPGEPIGCAWFWAHSHHVWCVLFQTSRDWVSIIGARHWEFNDPAHSLAELEASYPGKISKHILPAVATSGTPGDTLEDVFSDGREVYVAEPIDVHAGTGAVRRLLPGVLFGNEPGVRDLYDALSEFRSGGARLDEDSITVAPRPVNDAGLVAAQAIMVLAEFRSSGEAIAESPCALDWSARNIRRRFA